MPYHTDYNIKQLAQLLDASALARPQVYLPHVSDVCAALLTQEDHGALEEGLGFEQFTEGEDRLGWLMNYTTVRWLAAMHAMRSALLTTVCAVLSTHS